MVLKFEELKILQAAEIIADDIWKQIAQWDPFVRDTVGKQLARAADSIGANIAEAFGRYHYGEKVQFLYYARGSLFETKYWLNRTRERRMISTSQVQDYASQLSGLAHQLNSFISQLRIQQKNKSQLNTVSESVTEYMQNQPTEAVAAIFSDDEIKWIETNPNT